MQNDLSCDGTIPLNSMRGKSPDQSELNLFEPVLRQIVQHDHPLRVMADHFPWDDIEKEYASLYSEKGAPAKPVRLMAGLLILKQIFNASDEGIVSEWARDPCFQYFCGGNVFLNHSPCDPSDLPRFRKRIGKERLDRLMELSLQLQKKSGVGKIVVSKDARPGHEGFSYDVSAGLYQSFVTGIRNFAGKVSGMLQSATNKGG